jgi:uncharacterized protein (TIGR03663 family)
MKSYESGLLFILLATLLALCLRLPELELRPMHTDEAVHAVKFGRLLEYNEYTYDYHEYHGPTLNYFTLIPAWLGGAHQATQINDFTLRVVPVFFGVLLIVLHLWLIPGFGTRIVTGAVFLIAVSPAMVFYSRYYIQETLLVCFTFGIIACGYRYILSRKIIWALLAGLFVGLAHATKETCVITFGSIIFALILVVLLNRKSTSVSFRDIKKSHVLLMILTAILVSFCFYSSFFTNIPGTLDSLRFWSTYLDRAGQNDCHIHPWYYYLKWIGFNHQAGTPVWSEAFILLPAVFGLLAIFTSRGREILLRYKNINLNLLRFIAFYTIIMTIIYSTVPYKTPWCMLSFLHGYILLASVGMVVILGELKAVPLKLVFGLLLLAGMGHLIWQAYQANYTYCAAPANPYVYGHTSADIYQIEKRINEMAEVDPQGRNMNMAVICPGHDYWPLPWDLRSFTRVRYLDRVTNDIENCSLVIASPQVEAELIEKLYQLPPPGQKKMYVPLFDSYLELRPQVELRGYVTKELRDQLNDK